MKYFSRRDWFPKFVGKKVFFKQNFLNMVDLFSGEVESFSGGKDFSSNTSRKQNEKMKFLGSSKIWDEISLSDYFSNFLKKT